MADAYTGTPSVGWDQAAWDRFAYFAFRPQLHFDAVADVRPTNQSMPGTSVTFTQVGDLSITTTPLSETVDVDAEAITDSQVTLTLAEYGKATITTAKLRGTSFLPVQPVVAELIGTNAGQTMDKLGALAMQAGTNVRYGSAANGTAATARNNVTTDNTLKAANVRRAYTDLERANTPKLDGGFYASIVHPDIKLDLREQSGAGAWRVPREYVAPEAIWNNELGEFEGFRFMVTTNAPVFANSSNGSGSTGTIDVYRSLFFGRQALAKAHSIADGNTDRPQIVQGPVVDKLRRFIPMGWYWLGAYGIFRQGSLRAVESSSSIADNAA